VALRVVEGGPLRVRVFDAPLRVGRRGVSVPLPPSRRAGAARPRS
jgi:hypothetical protein